MRRSRQLDADMQAEMRFHVEMEAERLVREHGLSLQEARRQAHVRFGGVEKYKEAGRDARGLRWIDAMLLDSRFGVRMLVKHRGLTLVGGFALAIGIAVGASLFEVFSETLNPALPFPDGDRVVSLHFVGLNPGSPERQVLHDFTAIRDQLVSVEHFGAFRNAQHNLVSANTAPEPVLVAEITPAAFAIAQTPALLGRYLLPTDEPESASPVVVIGHQAWQTRFGADRNVVGRTINLGGIPRTVVGVMPDGFKFPVDHQYWIPLRENPLNYERWEGPAIYMFGRLAPGVTMPQAQAEFAAVAERTAVAHPETQGRLRPVVLPYTYEHNDISHPTLLWALRLGQLLAGALTFVVAINLAILVYARTVTRLGEIAVRSALGASRGRILAQLFIEALALSMMGAGTGVVVAYNALDVIQRLAHANGGGAPFWIQFHLSAAAVYYAFGLAVLAAIVMGVMPGLKATGVGLNANFHELNGRTGSRLGPTWTTLVVAQVAVAVAVLPAAVYIASHVVRMETTGPGFPAENIAVGSATLSDDGSASPSAADSNRITARQVELISRLRAEPGVVGVAFSAGIPGFAGSQRIRFEDGVRLRDTDTLMPSTVKASIDLFDTYGAEILAGRSFNASDVGAANNVVVNRSFVEMYLQETNALGLRFRFTRSSPEAAQPERWYQIVGVVRDFPSFPPNLIRNGEPTIYHPAAVGDIHPVTLSVRFAGPVPPGFVDRFREIGAEIDPALQLRRVGPLADRYAEGRAAWRSLAWAIALVTTSVLLLSAAGIYALMSFTVAQRTREIGIRTALGAHPRRVLLNVFARALRQLALGVLVGSVLSGATFVAMGLGLARATPLLLTVAAIMAIVGLLAALGPARRGLRIQAIEALRADT
jgi:predicted permease